MNRSEANETLAAVLRDTSWLSVAAIVFLVILLGSVAADITGKVGAILVMQESSRNLLQAFLIALLVNTPTLIIAGVVGDFAGFFSRTGEGEVFSPRNLRSLRSAGSGLVWAAAASAVIVPSVLSWTTGDGRGLIWHVNDLALGTAAMGAVIFGLSHVFAEGIRLKSDSDQII